MYARTDSSATDLRTRAATARESNASTSNVRPAPLEQGERLATATRGETEAVRVTWMEYKGRPFLNLRLWSRDASGQWWPTKDKGIAIRRHELADLADAVVTAMDRADTFAKTQDTVR